ncbi:hypothetical protein AB0C51_11705 [Streptomyces pathocidini]|uniref:DoxX family membrane protein n=1 Tax=Streptomyces pathocidini TaxID=1650571 RepID=A0ABW7UQN7_9ACTN|nr:hypothetical protein [Streptomyces pathocidini]
MTPLTARFAARQARQLPLRWSVGAFLLNSGLSKVDADEELAEQLHGFAVGTYPFLSSFEPKQFVSLLSKAELALAAALLVPVVPAAVAGAGLTAFSLGTVGLYLRTPGMRQEGSLKWTDQGLPLAKDAWMVGIGLSLLADGLPGLWRRCCHR